MKAIKITLKGKWLPLLTITIFILTACQKEIQQKKQQQEIPSVANNSVHGHLKQTKEFPSDVAIAWMNMQLELLRTPTVGLFPHQSRFIAYSGIALYESVVPGMPTYQSLSGQLTDLPVMPETVPGLAYHWPTCANAALAFMNKHFFTASNTSAANIAAMNALENSLNNIYQNEVDASTFQRSVDFGNAVAQIVFEWSKTDGSATVYPIYVPPVGPGLWVPTPPAFAPAAAPYWGNDRLFVQGSLNESAPTQPPAYSTDPSSDFYNMVKEVYDVSQTLTPEQTAIGLFWRDNPGFSGFGHFLSITRQILQQENSMLDVAAITYAKVGIAQSDAFIGCWQTKYQYNVERPITYIRTVMNHPTWNALFNTPAFPEFTSAHSSYCGAVGETLSGIFGSNYQFADHTYDYLSMAPHTYNSFQDLFNEMINARVYAGIHYRASDEKGIQQGRKIAQNINSKLKFLKE
jgi:hypothetical protein